MFRAAVITLCLALVACGGETELQLRADRKHITAGGIDHALITAKALVAGDPARVGTPVNFTTTSGSFTEGQEIFDTTIATDASGTAVAKLFSGNVPGNATVTAEFYDEASGISASASLTITFGEPTADQMPIADTFRLSCDAANIGALRDPTPNIKVRCEVTAQTRNGTTLPAVALRPEFRLEAGSITPLDDPYTGERQFIYSPKGGKSAPVDVAPDPQLGEPGFADAGRTRNPRDGLVTIIAVVEGEEAFSDSNGNGVYDPGELFVDEPEPFVDANDNNQRDPEEEFIDGNGNGGWDAANGVWDARAKIMAIYKILWTGALHNSTNTTRIQRTGSSIYDGGSLELMAYALDQNMNPVAAYQESVDYLEWTLEPGDSDAQSIDDPQPPMRNTRGFSFDKAANTERQRWLIVPNSFEPEPFKLTVQDGVPNDGESNPRPFTVSVQVSTTAGPDGEGGFLQQLTERFDERVQGTCD